MCHKGKGRSLPALCNLSFALSERPQGLCQHVVRCPAASSALSGHDWPPHLLLSHSLPSPEHLPIPFSADLASCTQTATPMGPQLHSGHVCNWSSNYFCVYLCSCATCDLNTLLTALEIWGAAEGHASIPPLWTNPVAFQDQNSKGPQIPTHLRERPPPDLPYIKYLYQKLRYLAILTGIFQRLSTLIYLCSYCSQLKLKAFEKSTPCLKEPGNKLDCWKIQPH